MRSNPPTSLPRFGLLHGSYPGLVLALVFGCCALWGPTAGAQIVVARKAAPDRLIVRYKGGASARVSSRALSRVGVRTLSTGRFSGVSVLQVTDKGKSLAEAIKELKRSGLVEFAEPDYVLHAASRFPDDEYFSSLWGLHQTGASGTGDADIDAPEAWDITTGDRSVVVGVIDSGVDYDHEDLAANIWTNPGEVLNGVDDDGNGYVDDIHGINVLTGGGDPMDDNRHGTHVAGTIGAVANNGVGVAGVAWDVEIMALKFLNANGSGYTSGAIECLEYATMMKIEYGVNVRVTNNSWGGGGYSTALAQAIEAAGAAGILFVAAAGNDSEDLESLASYPASYDSEFVLAVASSTSRNALSGFSNYGVVSVDLAAPGSSIRSTLPGGGYGFLSGTSMAAPHVSGAAVLVWAANPDADPLGVKSLLMNSADPKPAFAGKVASGGLLNAFAALASCETAEPVASFSLNEGFRVFSQQDQVVTLSLRQCASAVLGATVEVTSSQAGEILRLQDDGVAPDVSADDGVYSAVWSPTVGGAVRLDVWAGFSGGDLETSVSGEVIEAPVYISKARRFKWIDATAGTRVGLSSDDGHVEIDIGFSFPFYGIDRTSLRISSNGNLTFGTPLADYLNRPIPDPNAPDDIIAPYWDDLNPAAGGSIYTLLEGSEPNRRLTIEWLDVPYYNASGTASFEVTLYERGGRVVFQYLDVGTGSGGHAYGGSASVGVEHPRGTSGLESSYNAPVIEDGSALLVRPAPACQDGKDNDGDGYVDYPEDPECLSLFDDGEGELLCGLIGVELLLVWPLSLLGRSYGRRRGRGGAKTRVARTRVK